MQTEQVELWREKEGGDQIIKDVWKSRFKSNQDHNRMTPMTLGSICLALQLIEVTAVEVVAAAVVRDGGVGAKDGNHMTTIPKSCVT